MHVSWLALLLSAPHVPVELGDVAWRRDFDEAASIARASGRPLLVLFDEVPGCQTCVRYGQSVLRHPLLVEAAETLFVPLAVYNNRGGADRKVLQRFGEPSWNNPVVRILGPDARDLAPRLAGDYQVATLAQRMRDALEAAGREVPRWLSLVGEAASTRRLYMAMACFWSGEACLGGLEDVRATRTGWMKGREVVEIEVRSGREAEVLESAAQAGCGQMVFSDDPALLKEARSLKLRAFAVGPFRPTPQDDVHALRGSVLRALPMSSLQATRVNSSLSKGEDYREWLSPRQLGLLGRLEGKRGLPDPRAAPDLGSAHRRLRAALDAD